MFEEKNYVCFVLNRSGHIQNTGLNYCKHSELTLVTVWSRWWQKKRQWKVCLIRHF